MSFFIISMSFPHCFSTVSMSKNDQSLKACNFLDNGPILMLLKPLQISWSPLSYSHIFVSFPCVETIVHVETTVSFPFLPNLTPKLCYHPNQPIRIFHFIKSPRKCEISPKIFPYLKSKAVKTALLKTRWWIFFKLHWGIPITILNNLVWNFFHLVKLV